MCVYDVCVRVCVYDVCVRVCVCVYFSYLHNPHYIYCYTGEDCYTCLQLFTSSVKDFCVGSVANVTISTNRSHSHGDAITLYVNGNVCSSTHHGNGVVRCREHGSVVGHTLSYTITAIDDGMVTMRAHTNHYGANWYSTTVIITAVDQCK